MGRRQMDVDSMVSGVSPTISAALISLGIAMTSVGWICHALSLGCVLQAISDAPFSGNSFPRWLAATTVSTVGGFVVLIAPGGLGVREGLLIEALKDQPEISPSTAVIAAGLLCSLVRHRTGRCNRFLYCETKGMTRTNLFVFIRNDPRSNNGALRIDCTWNFFIG